MLKQTLAHMLPYSCLLLLLSVWLSQMGLAATRHTTSKGHQAAVRVTTPEPHTAVEHNNRGYELGSKGLWEQAIHEHEIALQMEPSNRDFMTNLSGAHLRYGDQLASQHRYDLAMKQYRHALFVDPNNNVADANLDGLIARLKKDPSNIKVRQKMAEDADVSQDYETAIVEYRRCVKMLDNGPAHAQLGRCLVKAGKDVDGFAELKLAVAKTWEPKTDKELMRDLASTHRQLGDILKEYAYKARDTGRGTVGMKRLLNASIEYRRAVTFNPDDGDAVRSLVEVAREATAIRPSFDNHLMLAGAYQLAGDFEHAKMEYENCWKADPRRPELAAAQQSFHLAVAKSSLASPADLANSVDKVQKALEKNPSDAMWWYVLGRAKQTQFERSGQQDDRQKAVDAYQKAAQINSYISPDLMPNLNLLSGNATPQEQKKLATQAMGSSTAYSADSHTNSSEKVGPSAANLLACGAAEKKLGSGEIDEAQKDLLAIVDKDVRNGRAWLLLGNSYEKKGDLDQAIVAYRQAALLKEPGASEALNTVADSRIQPMLAEADLKASQGNLVGAAASLRAAASIAPTKPLVHKKLAEVLRKMGDAKEAERELKKAADLEKSETKS